MINKIIKLSNLNIGHNFMRKLFMKNPDNTCGSDNFIIKLFDDESETLLYAENSEEITFDGIIYAKNIIPITILKKEYDINTVLLIESVCLFEPVNFVLIEHEWNVKNLKYEKINNVYAVKINNFNIQLISKIRKL